MLKIVVLLKNEKLCSIYNMILNNKKYYYYILYTKYISKIIQKIM